MSTDEEFRMLLRPTLEPLARMPGSYLYLVQSRDGRIKIGRTQNLRHRRNWLKSTQKVDVRYLAVFPDSGGKEPYLHYLLNAYAIDPKTCREWYPNNPTVREMICRLLGIDDAPFRKPWPPRRTGTKERCKQGVKVPDTRPGME